MSQEVFYIQVWFEGQVQGVCFRHNTSQVAVHYAVTGTVENLPDGRVYLQAEGDEDEVLDFVAAIEEKMRGYIQGSEKDMSLRIPQFEGFRITG